jgi:ATP-dependent Clp protease ATP-binding subunit ClpC
MDINVQSKRAQRARLQAKLGKKFVKGALTSTTLALIALGCTLIFAGYSLGWVVLAFAVPLAMTRLWYAGDLQDITVQKNSQQLDAQLEASLLGRLPVRSDLSIHDVWKAIEGLEESYMLANRYGIDGSFFETFADKTPGSAQKLWQQVNKVHEAYPHAGFSTMLVLVTIVLTTPNNEQLLRGAGLEVDDVPTAIDWMYETKAKRALVKARHNFGGIGRDWAFGYTPLLRNVGLNISEGIQAHGFFSEMGAHQQVVGQMLQTMAISTGTVTLVGEVGAGKTTCVHAFAHELLKNNALPRKLRFSQVIQIDATTLIANAKRPGDLETLMTRVLNEAHHAKNIILYFDEAQLFFGAQNGIDISHVIMTALESSSVRLVFSMDPRHWQELSAKGVVARLTPINVAPLDEASTLDVLRDQVTIIEYRNKVVFTYDALKEAYKLGTRYVTNQAMPGAALQVLSQAATGSQQQLITREVIQQAIEQTYGIKLQVARAEETDNLLNLEQELHKQVISQDRAVSVVANALRRARSGVSNPNRPIGTFLFLGPTGVGKTELSKAIARSYFQNENALIRVDMNQYVNADDVNRLISPLSATELGFLGEVRKQPFSVILFDEIEKAHPSVVNALLQMLDEGMMRDNENRAVSFRDAVIVATSNAGADDIRKSIEAGQDISQLESTFVDTLIAHGSFAPEFLNRFDEVVLFKPLDQTDLIAVIDLILSDINKTLDAQKVSVYVSDAGKQWLVAKGYDSKLGARPMRRMAQRYIENIVAKRLLERSVQAGGVVQLDVADFENNEG